MGKRRVVVTGLGCVTPLGLDLPSTWEGLVNGRSGIDSISRFDTDGYRSKVAGEVHNFPMDEYKQDKNLRQMGAFVLFAVAAAREAFNDSGLNISDENPNRIGVYIGSGIGGIGMVEDECEVMRTRGHRRVTPYFIPRVIPNMGPGVVSIDLGLKGPNSCVTTACATGTHAIGDASRIIREGDAVAMVAGGTESCITPLAMAGFGNMRALTERNDDPKKASCPFDRRRDGFVMAEGAGIVVLEELEHAKARDARIYAEVIGYGMSGDANHITAPAPGGEGGARAMTDAVNSAGVNPDDVDYINAHGTSTPLNDKLETQGIKSVFGDHARKLAISSCKSMIGHLIGAAGAVEAIATIKAIETGVIPPTINYEEPDPECDLDYVPNEAREAPVNIAMSNSLGFGGHNCTITLKKFS
jgi:3-oxoacyl-[acyl-carrier-protein] synthase II